MRFFTDKIITPFNTQDATVGQYYLACDYLLNLKDTIEDSGVSSKNVLKLVNIKSEAMCPFIVENNDETRLAFQFLYPIDLIDNIDPKGAILSLEDNTKREIYFIKDGDNYRIYTPDTKELDPLVFATIKDIESYLETLKANNKFTDFGYIW